MKRNQIVAVMALVAVAALVIGLVAGRQIKSPADILAETASPEPSLITVPVELRELSHSVVVRGTVRANEATEVPVPSSPTGISIVTRSTKAAGDEVKQGDVLVEISGRPIIALEGQLPVFRNLIPTLEGPDVAQLERSLQDLGYDPGTVDDVYDLDTATAVEALYTDAGYSPPEIPESDRQSLLAAREMVNAQQAAVGQAEQAVEQASAPLSESQKLQLDQSVLSAENRLASVRVEAAQLKADAADALAEAQSAQLTAAGELQDATDRLAEAEAGTHPDTALPPTQAELDQLRAEKRDAQEALGAADDAVEAAVTSMAEIDTAQDNAIQASIVELQIQQAVRDEAQATPDLESLQDALEEARDQLTQAQVELDEAQARAAIPFPTSELVFFPSLPRQVQSINADVGDTPMGSVMTVAGVDTRIESGVSSANRRLIEVGDAAVIDDESLGISAKAVVTFVADNPGGGDLSSDRYGLVLEPVEPLPEDVMNVNLRVSIPISSSGGEVLAVPYAALSAGSDGTARVEVERPGGQVELLDVVTGLRAEGFVEIEPVGGLLQSGDRVVVGRDLNLSGVHGSDPDDDADEDSLGALGPQIPMIGTRP